jgi:hypothetical protein
MWRSIDIKLGIFTSLTAPISIKLTVIQFLQEFPVLNFVQIGQKYGNCRQIQVNYGFHDTHLMELTFAQELYMDICCTGFLPDLINKNGK